MPGALTPGQVLCACLVAKTSLGPPGASAWSELSCLTGEAIKTRSGEVTRKRPSRHPEAVSDTRVCRLDLVAEVI